MAYSLLMRWQRRISERYQQSSIAGFAAEAVAMSRLERDT
jgi:hypothetical protein